MKFIILTLLLAFSATSQAWNGEMVETFIAKVFLKMKVAMREGSDNLWVMDPVTTKPGVVKTFDDIKVPFAKVKELSISNVDIRGLSTYRIEKLNVNPMKNVGSVELVIDELGGHADYKIDAKAAGFIPIRGQGPANLKVKDTRFMIDVVFEIIDERILFIDELKLDMKFGKVDLHLSGLNGAKPGSQLAKYFDRLLSHFKDLLVENILRDFKDYMNNKFKRCPLDAMGSAGCHELFDF